MSSGCNVPAHVEPEDVAGALNGISTAKFPKEGFVSAGHSKAVEEVFVWGVPTAEGADHEGEDLALFSKADEVGFEWFVLGNFCGCRLLEGVRAIIEWAGDIDDERAVFFFDYDIRAERETRFTDCSVGGDVAKAGGVCEAGD